MDDFGLNSESNNLNIKCGCGKVYCITCKDMELDKTKKKLNKYERALKILMEDEDTEVVFDGINNDDRDHRDDNKDINDTNAKPSYHQFDEMDDFKGIDKVYETYDDYAGNNQLYNSIIFTKEDGNSVKKRKSNLGDSYYLIDGLQDLDQITTTEKDSIESQNTLRTFKSVRKYFKQGSTINSAYSLLAGAAGVVTGFF
jgi:hypothetical protein